MTEEIMNAISSEVYGVWFLIGAALVFWMQAGFAMVEAGFTRAKNTGNIIMKNLMDFCIGTVMFILIGFGLFLGEDVAGIFGKPGFDIFTNYANFDWSNFVFNLVFCATTATIVSGAMAERTKFLSYCVYSAVISAVIYPIEAHWTWGNGFLVNMGFHDSRSRRMEASRLAHSQDITWHLVHLVYLSCGLAGMDLMVQPQHQFRSLVRYSQQQRLLLPLQQSYV